MTIYYSKSQQGFYDSAVHKAVPEDAVEVALADYKLLLEAQGQGKIISSNECGYPIAAKQESSLEELTAQKHEAAQAEKVRAVNAGCVVDGVLFDSDQAAKIAYLGLERKFRDKPSYVKEGWKASLGVWVDMNAALFLQVVNAVEQHESDCFAWQKAKDDEIDAAAKQGLAELEAVTIEYQPAN